MIFAYVRCSTDEQKDGSSPDEQEKRCRAIATLRGAGPYDIAVYRDLGVSGGIPLAHRPGGSAMLEAASTSDCIIASKLDRMFRNTLDALQSLEHFKMRGIEIVLADLSSEPVNGTGVGKLMFSMLAMIADFEKDRINTRTQEGRRAKAARQGHLGGDAPYGWRVDGEGRDAKLVPNPDEQKPIEIMLDFRKRGFSPGNILKSLDRHGYRDRAGKPFNFMQMKRIVAYQERVNATGHA